MADDRSPLQKAADAIAKVGVAILEAFYDGRVKITIIVEDPDTGEKTERTDLIGNEPKPGDESGSGPAE